MLDYRSITKQGLPKEEADELIAADIIPPGAGVEDDVEERRRN